jgi:DNA-directed RNA polymerase specialized sigma24 family protein
MMRHGKHSGFLDRLPESKQGPFRRGKLMYRQERLKGDSFLELLYALFRKRLAEAISSLPEEQQLVVILYYYEEFTLAQIAIIMEMSTFRASQLYSSGVLNLRARLGDAIGKGERTIHTSARPANERPGLLK